MTVTAFQFRKLAAATLAGPPRIFDWAQDCPDAVGRVFPAIVGTGRGHVVEPFRCIRCGRESWRSFGIHRPLDSDRRSCSGTVVPRSQVDRARVQENERFIVSMLRVAQQESGWRPV